MTTCIQLLVQDADNACSNAFQHMVKVSLLTQYFTMDKYVNSLDILLHSVLEQIDICAISGS